MLYLTADLHFGHHNIIKYCDRPFKHVAEMNDTLIANINDLVKSKDKLWILGDISFDNPEIYLKKLQCNDIHIVPGGHDRRNMKNIFKENQHITVHDKIFNTRYGNTKITMCHYPMLSWHGSYHGTRLAFGHCHGKLTNLPKHSMDVGIDAVLNYSPISIEEFLEITA